MDYTILSTFWSLIHKLRSWSLPNSSCPNGWWVRFAGPCWPAGVAQIWLWWCVLTDSGAKAGILTALLLGLVSFSRTQIWSRPDLFDLLTGFLLRAAVLTLTHKSIHTYRRQTYTNAWQTGKYFITLCNGRASGYCTRHEQQDYCRLAHSDAIFF